MNDLFNILIFSKDYNQGVIIQDYIKAIGYNSRYRHERNTDIGSHDQKFGKYHPCRFLV